MVQIIENRTDLSGTISARSPHPTRDGYDLIDVNVTGATAVDGFADLLSSDVGSRVSIAVPRQLLPAGDVSDLSIRCRAAMVGPGIISVVDEPTAATFDVGSD